MYRDADCEKTQAPPNRIYTERQEREQLREMQLKQESYARECNAGGMQAARPMSSAEILAELFSYHPPTPETLPKFAAINQAAKNFAEIVLQNCPPSPDRTAVITLIQDARMTANRAVALNGLSLERHGY